MRKSVLLRSLRSVAAFVPFLSLGLVAACGGDSTSSVADAGTDAHVPTDSGSDLGVDAGTDLGVDAGPTTRAFSIRFRGMVGSTPASCGTDVPGFGPAADQTVRFKDFRFYVHGIELVRADQTTEPLVIDDALPWQRAGVALLDFEDGTRACGNGTLETRSVVTGTALSGPYVGIRFVLGVPFEQNHQDRSTAQPPLSLSALFWSWQGGYKFLRADVETVPSGADAGAPATFNVHIGSTGCDGTPTGGVTMCTAPNRPTIALTAFDPDANAIEVDFAAIVGSSDIAFNTPTTAPGCMSAPTDPECGEVLPSLGIPFGANPPTSDAFRVGPLAP